jgi:hypothetical protein
MDSVDASLCHRVCTSHVGASSAVNGGSPAAWQAALAELATVRTLSTTKSRVSAARGYYVYA